MLHSLIQGGKWLLLLPLMFYTGFFILTMFSWFEKIDKKKIRRIYYLFSLIWSVAFIVVFQDRIENKKIISSYFVDHATINLILTAIFIALFTFVWDVLFISCHSVSKLSLKGLEITTQEFTEATKAIESKVEDLLLLERIMKVQYILIMDMHNYYISLKYFNSNTIYTKLIKKYVRLRRNVSIDCYPYNSQGLEKVKKDLKVDDVTFSSIYHTLEVDGVCLPLAGKVSDKLFAVVNVSFAYDDLLLVISSERIAKNEHLILQSIISHFDAILELEGLKLEVQDYRQVLQASQVHKLTNQQHQDKISINK